MPPQEPEYGSLADRIADFRRRKQEADQGFQEENPWYEDLSKLAPEAAALYYLPGHRKRWGTKPLRARGSKEPHLRAEHRDPSMRANDQVGYLKSFGPDVTGHSWKNYPLQPGPYEAKLGPQAPERMGASYLPVEPRTGPEALARFKTQLDEWLALPSAQQASPSTRLPEFYFDDPANIKPAYDMLARHKLRPKYLTDTMGGIHGFTIDPLEPAPDWYYRKSQLPSDFDRPAEGRIALSETGSRGGRPLRDGPYFEVRGGPYHGTVVHANDLERLGLPTGETPYGGIEWPRTVKGGKGGTGKALGIAGLVGAGLTGLASAADAYQGSEPPPPGTPPPLPPSRWRETPGGFQDYPSEPEPDTLWGGRLKGFSDYLGEVGRGAFESAAHPESLGDFLGLMLPSGAPNISRAFPEMSEALRARWNRIRGTVPQPPATPATPGQIPPGYPRTPTDPIAGTPTAQPIVRSGTSPRIPTLTDEQLAQQYEAARLDPREVNQTPFTTDPAPGYPIPPLPPKPRAAGGPVIPGQPYLVGEQGPEVIVSNTPGMVLPAAAAAAMGAGQPGAAPQQPAPVAGTGVGTSAPAPAPAPNQGRLPPPVSPQAAPATKLPPPPPNTLEITALSPAEEALFQQWVKDNGITDLDHPASYYDYRGFWQDTKGAPHKAGDHFPDTYKRHGHPTFSVESKYSAGPGDGGRWDGDRFIPGFGQQGVPAPIPGSGGAASSPVSPDDLKFDPVFEPVAEPPVQPTLPAWRQVADPTMEAMPWVLGATGSMVGGIAGAPAGPPGVAGGAVLGAGAGGIWGQNLRSWYRHLTGQEPSPEALDAMNKALASGNEQMLWEIAGQGVGAGYKYWRAGRMTPQAAALAEANKKFGLRLSIPEQMGQGISGRFARWAQGVATRRSEWAARTARGTRVIGDVGAEKSINQLLDDLIDVYGHKMTTIGRVIQGGVRAGTQGLKQGPVGQDLNAAKASGLPVDLLALRNDLMATMTREGTPQNVRNAILRLFPKKMQIPIASGNHWYVPFEQAMKLRTRFGKAGRKALENIGPEAKSLATLAYGKLSELLKQTHPPFAAASDAYRVGRSAVGERFVNTIRTRSPEKIIEALGPSPSLDRLIALRDTMLTYGAQHPNPPLNAIGTGLAHEEGFEALRRGWFERYIVKNAKGDVDLAGMVARMKQANGILNVLYGDPLGQETLRRVNQIADALARRVPVRADPNLLSTPRVTAGALTGAAGLLVDALTGGGMSPVSAAASATGGAAAGVALNEGVPKLITWAMHNKAMSDILYAAMTMTNPQRRAGVLSHLVSAFYDDDGQPDDAIDSFEPVDETPASATIPVKPTGMSGTLDRGPQPVGTSGQLQPGEDLSPLEREVVSGAPPSRARTDELPAPPSPTGFEGEPTPSGPMPTYTRGRFTGLPGRDITSATPEPLTEGVMQMGSGARNLLASTIRSLDRTVGRGRLGSGGYAPVDRGGFVTDEMYDAATEIAHGGFETLTPAIVAGALVAPGPTAVGLLLATLGDESGQTLAALAGGTPSQQKFAGVLGSIIAAGGTHKVTAMLSEVPGAIRSGRQTVGTWEQSLYDRARTSGPLFGSERGSIGEEPKKLFPRVPAGHPQKEGIEAIERTTAGYGVEAEGNLPGRFSPLVRAINQNLPDTFTADELYSLVGRPGGKPSSKARGIKMEERNWKGFDQYVTDHVNANGPEAPIAKADLIAHLKKNDLQMIISSSERGMSPVETPNPPDLTTDWNDRPSYSLDVTSPGASNQAEWKRMSDPGEPEIWRANVPNRVPQGLPEGWTPPVEDLTAEQAGANVGYDKTVAYFRTKEEAEAWVRGRLQHGILSSHLSPTAWRNISVPGYAQTGGPGAYGSAPDASGYSGPGEPREGYWNRWYSFPGGTGPGQNPRLLPEGYQNPHFGTPKNTFAHERGQTYYFRPESGEVEQHWAVRKPPVMKSQPGTREKIEVPGDVHSRYYDEESAQKMVDEANYNLDLEYQRKRDEQAAKGRDPETVPKPKYWTMEEVPASPATDPNAPLVRYELGEEAQYDPYQHAMADYEEAVLKAWREEADRRLKQRVDEIRATGQSHPNWDADRAETRALRQAIEETLPQNVFAKPHFEVTQRDTQTGKTQSVSHHLTAEEAQAEATRLQQDFERQGYQPGRYQHEARESPGIRYEDFFHVIDRPRIDALTRQKAELQSEKDYHKNLRQEREAELNTYIEQQNARIAQEYGFANMHVWNDARWGYYGPERTRATEAASAMQNFRVTDPEARRITGLIQEEINAVNSANTRLQPVENALYQLSSGGDKSPDFPFKEKSAHTEFVAKQHLIESAMNKNIEGIAITGGHEQAGRSSGGLTGGHLQRYHSVAFDPGSGMIALLNKSGDQVGSFNVYKAGAGTSYGINVKFPTIADLEPYLGRKVARQLLDKLEHQLANPRETGIDPENPMTWGTAQERETIAKDWKKRNLGEMIRQEKEEYNWDVKYEPMLNSDGSPVLDYWDEPRMRPAEWRVYRSSENKGGPYNPEDRKTYSVFKSQTAAKRAILNRATYRAKRRPNELPTDLGELKEVFENIDPTNPHGRYYNAHLGITPVAIAIPPSEPPMQLPSGFTGQTVHYNARLRNLYEKLLAPFLTDTDQKVFQRVYLRGGKPGQYGGGQEVYDVNPRDPGYRPAYAWILRLSPETKAKILAAGFSSWALALAVRDDPDVPDDIKETLLQAARRSTLADRRKLQGR